MKVGGWFLDDQRTYSSDVSERRCSVYRLTVRLLITLLLVSVLVACDASPVAQDINQSKANKIVALLHSYGIGAVAKKQSGGRSRYRVEVNRAHYSQAVRLLDDRNLLDESELTFAELTEPRGFLPNSREVESLRLDHAVAIELQQVLENHPGLESVRAVVRMHFQKDAGESAVALIGKKRPGAVVDENEIRDLVMQSLPGVETVDIEISLHEGTVSSVGQVSSTQGLVAHNGRVLQVPLVPFLFRWQIPEGQYNSLVLLLVGLLVLILIAGGVIGYWLAYYNAAKSMHPVDLLDVGEISPHPAIEDRSQFGGAE